VRGWWILDGKKGVLIAFETELGSDMGIFFDDWQACLRSHYIYVIRAGDAVTEPTLRHVLVHSGVDEAELDALRAQAEALGPLDPDAPAEAVRAPEQDAAPNGDQAGGGDVDEIAVPEAALDETGAPPDGEDGEPDGAAFDGDDEGDIPGDDLYEDDAYEDDEPPVAPNQLSLF
jgi:hypothetical protein